jgi:hypothetical protein
MHPKEIVEKLNLLDQNNPIRDPKSIQRITLWAAEHPGFAGCDNEVLKKYCDKENCFYHELKSGKKEFNHGTVTAGTCWRIGTGRNYPNMYGYQADRPRLIQPFSPGAD